MSEPAVLVCPRCGADEEDFVAGLCSVCVFGDAHARGSDLAAPPSDGGSGGDGPNGAPAELPELPRRIANKYEVLGCLGTGEQNQVFRVRDPHAKRDVALKLLRCGLGMQQRARESFRRDLELLSRFHHQNIVQVYETSGIEHADPYYTMQLVEGGSLNQPQHREHFREPRRAAQLVATLARAIHECHFGPQPLFHRDIKLANILVGPNDHPYLTDFGIAVDISPGAAITRSRAGTVAYMSPEQAAGKELGLSTDIYSLGVVLYELLTGVLPHQADAEHEMLRLIRKAPIAKVRKREKNVPLDLSEICMTALAKVPGERYATAEAFAEDLERHLRNEAPRLVRRRPIWQQSLSWVVRHPSLAAVSLAALLSVYFIVDSGTGIIRDQENKLLARTQREQRAIAKAQARSVYDDFVEIRRTLDAEVARAMERDLPELSAWLPLPAASRPPFGVDLEYYMRKFDELHRVDSIAVFNGMCKAEFRQPFDAGVLNHEPYDYRDYCRIAKALAERHIKRAAVALAHVSNTTLDQIEIPFVTPLFDASDKFAGFVLAQVIRRNVFGTMLLETEKGEGGEEERLSVLIGPRDRDSMPDTNLDKLRYLPDAPDYLLLVHPDVRDEKAPKSLSSDIAISLWDRFRPADDPVHGWDLPDSPVFGPHAWIDPASGKPGWSAFIAPVGHTGYLVAVPMQRDAATRPITELLERVRTRGVPLAIVWAGITVFVLWFTRRERRRY